jgi:hypothetical protein
MPATGSRTSSSVTSTSSTSGPWARPGGGGRCGRGSGRCELLSRSWPPERSLRSFRSRRFRRLRRLPPSSSVSRLSSRRAPSRWPASRLPALSRLLSPLSRVSRPRPRPASRVGALAGLFGFSARVQRWAVHSARFGSALVSGACFGTYAARPRPAQRVPQRVGGLRCCRGCFAAAAVAGAGLAAFGRLRLLRVLPRRREPQRERQALQRQLQQLPVPQLRR